MSVSPVKRLILETMWAIEKPAKAAEIAKNIGVNFPAVMMHLIGLTKMEYVKTPEKGFYVISEKGKKMLGLPEISGEQAKQILEYLPLEKAFHFYAGVGNPLNVHAASLGDFLEKIQKIDPSAIEFHTDRGDFEAWFAGLGDSELARKTLLVREQRMLGEELREKLSEIIRNRCEELAGIRGSIS